MNQTEHSSKTSLLKEIGKYFSEGGRQIAVVLGKSDDTGKDVYKFSRPHLVKVVEADYEGGEV